MLGAITFKRSQMADVVYFINDMLFSSKLREAAKATGVTVQGAREPAAFAAAAREAIDHEKTDVMDAARAKGCSDVMAKGQFANALPKLLASIVSAPVV